MGRRRPAGGARRARRRRIPRRPPREVYLLQRKAGQIGKGLGKTTGWVHRASLKAKGVHQLSRRQLRAHRRRRACTSASGPNAPTPRCSTVDNVVICAGQEPVRDLEDGAAPQPASTPHVIGGADVAAELDAKRAIRTRAPNWPPACNPLCASAVSVGHADARSAGIAVARGRWAGVRCHAASGA